MSERDYNGWTNYETWAAKLWMDNEQSSQEYWAETTLACWHDAEATKYLTREQVARHMLVDRLVAMHDDAMPDMDVNIYSDLLTAASGRIDWHEIAKSLLAEVDQTEKADQ